MNVHVDNVSLTRGCVLVGHEDVPFNGAYAFGPEEFVRGVALSQLRESSK